MKRNFYLMLLLSFLGAPSLWAQEDAVSFTLEVSHDSIKVGGKVTVTYTLTGARGDFQAPEFSGLRLVGGPNYSSSISIVNGAMDQTFTYTYIFQLTEAGDFLIPSASVKAGGKTYESPSTHIHAIENPDWNPQLNSPERSFERKSGKKKNVTQI